MIARIEDPELARDLARRRKQALFRLNDVAIEKSYLDDAVACELLKADDRESQDAVRKFVEHAVFAYLHSILRSRKRLAEVEAGAGPIELSFTVSDELIGVLVSERYLVTEQRRDPYAIAAGIQAVLHRMREQQFPTREIPVSAMGVARQETGRGGLTVVYGNTRRSG